MNSSEKQAIESFLNEEAQEVSRQCFAGGVLTVWRNAHSFPSRRACTFISRDGSVIVPNRSEVNFYTLLADAIVAGADKPQICEALAVSSPVPRRVLVELPPYLNYLAESWHEPRLERGRFECYVENLASGRVERIAIDQCDHGAADVGEGLRFSFL